MRVSRRQVLTLSGAALGSRMFGGPQTGEGRLPWHQKMRRCGQINFNERDPQTLGIDGS